MARQYYLLYAVNVNNGTPASSLRLYSDAYGTPEATGTVIEMSSGSGPGLTAVIKNGVSSPNKTSWTDTMSNRVVNVWKAGTNKALVWLNYNGTDYYFDASSCQLSPSASSPSLYTFNSNGVIMATTDRRPTPPPDYIPVYAKIKNFAVPNTAESIVTLGTIEDVIASITGLDVWSNSGSYGLDDVVVNKGKIYKSTMLSDPTSPKEPNANPDYWTEIRLSDLT